MTTKDNPGTLPINLYAVGPPDVQPLDLTKLGDHHSVQQMPQKEVTEFLYTSNQSTQSVLSMTKVALKTAWFSPAYRRMLKLA